MIDLSDKKILCWDRGFYTALCQKLGERASHVWYYLPESSPYPCSSLAQIGSGLPEIERIDGDMVWKCMDKADMIFFPDCYDGEFQEWLKGKGYRVFGGLGSEKTEMDKLYFYEYLEKVGLPVPKTFRAEGLDEAEEHLKTCRGDRWLKTSYYRGDFDTKHFRNMRQIKPWLNDLRSKLGMRAGEIEILIQSPIKSVCEVGGDRFCINGDFSPNPLVGYEVKDEAYVGKIFDEMPAIIDDVDQKMVDLFRKKGFQGHWSNELRITENGKAYFIDATPRAPSPPSELMCEMYEDYPGDVWTISGGEIPKCKPKKDAVFGIEIILISTWHVDHELCVTYPKELEPHLKFKNHCRKNGAVYCIPNDNAGFFGGLVNWGTDLDKTIEEACDMMKEIEADGLDFSESVFDKAREQIESGRQWGITF